MDFKNIIILVIVILIIIYIWLYCMRKPNEEKYINLTVFSSSRDQIDDEYKMITKKLISEIDDKKFRIVYGGDNGGLMDIVSNTWKGNILSINYPKFHPAKEDIVYNNIFEREKHLVEAGDVYLFLPGGTGTVTELMYTILFNQVTANSESEKRDILILNYNGIYDTFFTFLDELTLKKFVDNDYLEKYKIKLFTNAEDIVQYLNTNNFN